MPAGDEPAELQEQRITDRPRVGQRLARRGEREHFITWRVRHANRLEPARSQQRGRQDQALDEKPEPRRAECVQPGDPQRDGVGHLGIINARSRPVRGRSPRFVARPSRSLGMRRLQAAICNVSRGSWLRELTSAAPIYDRMSSRQAPRGEIPGERWARRAGAGRLEAKAMQKVTVTCPRCLVQYNVDECIWARPGTAKSATLHSCSPRWWRQSREPTSSRAVGCTGRAAVAGSSG